MANSEDAKSAYSGYPMIFVAIVIFSTIEVVSQHLQKELGVSALDMALLRFGIGGAFLAVAAWAQVGRKRMFEIVRKDGLRLALYGLLGTTIVSLSFHESLMLTSSMIGGAIFSVNPAVVALIFVVFRVEKPKWSTMMGILLGIACICATNIGAEAHEPEFPRYFVGNMLMVVAVLAWSFYFLLVRDYLKKYSPLVVGCIAVNGGTIGLLLFAPFAPYFGWEGSLSFLGILTPIGWVLALYLGIFTIGVGYYLLYSGLAKTGISRGMMSFFIKPALVALLAYFLQDQPLSMWIAVGIILAAASVFAVGLDRS